jgi:hypothetical protein
MLIGSGGGTRTPDTRIMMHRLYPEFQGLGQLKSVKPSTETKENLPRLSNQDDGSGGADKENAAQGVVALRGEEIERLASNKYRARACAASSRFAPLYSDDRTPVGWIPLIAAVDAVVANIGGAA